MSIMFIPLVEDLVSSESQDFWKELSAVEAEQPDLSKVLPLLPEIEAEMFWLGFEKHKNQKEIAQLLDLPQSTVSYRYRRAIQKIYYLMLLTAVDVKAMVDQYTFLREGEKEILVSLFYTTNQDLTARKFNRRQSSVKWIMLKTLRRVERLEQEEPERWFNHYGLMQFLVKNLGVRVMHEECGS